MPRSGPRQKKTIPSFRSEREEREFWEAHDTADYVGWSDARIARLPSLKPTTTTISLRLPAPLLADLKALANKRDVPYQSLLKVFVVERVAAGQRLPDKHLARASGPTTQRRRTARAGSRRSAALAAA